MKLSLRKAEKALAESNKDCALTLLADDSWKTMDKSRSITSPVSSPPKEIAIATCRSIYSVRAMRY
ncbi:hypothetical protein I8X65_00010735, partial [Escherichia coli]